MKFEKKSIIPIRNRINFLFENDNHIKKWVDAIVKAKNCFFDSDFCIQESSVVKIDENLS